MAVNQIAKRQNLAAKMIELSTGLMNNVTALVAAADEYTSSGLTFQDSDFADVPGLEHVDAASMTAVITSTTALDTWIRANFHDDNFTKVRR